MSAEVKNKVVVITGASSGFGEAMALAFGAAGAKLLLVARGKDKLDAVAARIVANGGTATTCLADVTKADAFEGITASCLSTYGQLDVLINNVGGGVKIAHVDEQEPADIEAAIQLNLISVINACRHVVPVMKKQKSGLIINLTSACDRFGWPGWAVYSAAKAGISMFDRCLYTEVREFGIGVTTLVPGGSNTGFQKGAGIDDFEWDEGNALRPEHIADAAVAIASMKPGAVVPEMVVMGKAQEIVPF